MVEPYLEGVHDGQQMALSWMSGRSMGDPSLRPVYDALRDFLTAVDPLAPEPAPDVSWVETVEVKEIGGARAQFLQRLLDRCVRL